MQRASAQYVEGPNLADAEYDDPGSYLVSDPQLQFSWANHQERGILVCLKHCSPHRVLKDSFRRLAATALRLGFLCPPAANKVAAKYLAPEESRPCAPNACVHSGPCFASYKLQCREVVDAVSNKMTLNSVVATTYCERTTLQRYTCRVVSGRISGYIDKNWNTVKNYLSTRFFFGHPIEITAAEVVVGKDRF